MNHRPAAYLVAGLFFVSCPATALANAGTPLMWAGMIHLMFGNLLIGLAEGWMLARWFGVPRTRAVSTMVGANYLSAWLGLLILQSSVVTSFPVNLDNGWQWYWIAAAATFGLTLLVEFPFVLWALRQDSMRMARPIRASLTVQASSYLVLFAWYSMAGHVSLYTRGNIVRPESLQLPKEVTVWFIDPDDGHVYRRALGQPVAEKVFDLRSNNHNDRVLARASSTNPSRKDLVARLETGDSRNPNFVLVSTNVNLVVPSDRPEDSASPTFSSEYVVQFRTRSNPGRHDQSGVELLDCILGCRRTASAERHTSKFRTFRLRDTVRLVDLSQRRPTPQRSTHLPVGPRPDLRLRSINPQLRPSLPWPGTGGGDREIACSTSLLTFHQLCPAARHIDPAGVVPHCRRHLSQCTSSNRAARFAKAVKRCGIVGVSLHSYRYAWAERAKMAGYPERYAQEALGHKSKAVHRAYARKARVELPPLEEYEKRSASEKVIPPSAANTVDVRGSMLDFPNLSCQK